MFVKFASFSSARLSFAALVASCVFAAQTARAEKTVVEPIYTITVPPGFSNTFDSVTGTLPDGVSFKKTSGGVETDCAYENFFAEEAAGTLVKKGTGWLVIDKALSNWSGQIHVDEGVLHVCVATGGLGKELISSGFPADGDATFVKSGATLLMDSSGMPRKQRYERKKIVFEGEGAEGLTGALIAYQHGTLEGDGNQNWWFGQTPTLSGDAVLGCDTEMTRTMFFNDPKTALMDLGGHTLRIVKAGSSNLDFNHNGAVITNGHIVMEQGCYHQQNSGAVFARGAPGSLTLTNNAYLYWEACEAIHGHSNWTLRVCGNNYFQQAGKENGHDFALTNNRAWYGAIELNKTLALSSATNAYSLTFGGPISGDGGFRINNNNANLWIHLTHPTNTFKGGMKLTKSSLLLYADGALPAAEDSGSLAITNGNLFVVNSGLEDYYDAATYNSTAKTNGLCRRYTMEYTLPAAEFVGTGTVLMVSGKAKDRSRVRAPRKPGRWMGPVVKRGAGELVYDAPMGGALEIREGGVKLGFAGAGLFESHVDFNTTKAGAQQFYESSVTLTNEVKLVPEMAYGRGKTAGWDGHTAGIYEGWLWNRETTNVNWSFAIACNAKAKVVLDGTLVCEGTNSGKKGTVNDVTPGPHHFELRMYTTSGVGGVQQDYPSTFKDESGKNYWPTNTVFWWDPNGCDKTDIHYYRKLQDPGDGSLLSLAADGAPAGCGLVPQFTNVTIRAGAYLDLNGNGTYEVENLAASGGEIRNSNALFTDMTVKVGKGLSLSGTPTEGKSLLSVAGKLTLTDGADVTVDTTGFQKKSFSLMSAEDGIEGLPEEITFTGKNAERYGVRLSEDGKSLTCVYTQPGGILLIR